MPSFSETSLQELHGCCFDLQSVLREAIKYQDFTVLCGYRGKEAQDEAFRTGNSNVQWPNGRHNSLPSNAVDIAPYPVDWKDVPRFALLAGRIMQIADQMGITLRWGGDWDRDTSTVDQNLKDWGHFEVFEPPGVAA